MKKLKKSEFTVGSMKNGLVDKFVVNKNGRFYADALDRNDAKRKADRLNQEHGMEQLYAQK